MLVGVGGMLGSMLRYALTLWIQRRWPTAPLMYATLAVNLIGCAAIGALAGWLLARETASAELRIFAGVGVLGGFTTFSAFGYETFALVRDGDPLRALANVALQVLLGLGAVWTGYTVLSRS
jgi:fluoride exporter